MGAHSSTTFALMARRLRPSFPASRRVLSTSVKHSYVPQYTCDIDAEPLHRYSLGGYHPVHLGDYLKDGRYKILHKLGWVAIPLYGLHWIGGQPFHVNQFADM